MLPVRIAIVSATREPRGHKIDQALYGKGAIGAACPSAGGGEAFWGPWRLDLGLTDGKIDAWRMMAPSSLLLQLGATSPAFFASCRLGAGARFRRLSFALLVFGLSLLFFPLSLGV